MELTAQQLDLLLAGLDRDGDHHINFDELLYFLSHQKELQHLVGSLKLQADLMSNNAALAAGAAMGLLPFLKGKLAVGLGTLFYDPIRLYRDCYVEYCTAVRSQIVKLKHDVTLEPKLQGMTAAELNHSLGFMDAMRVHARAGGSILCTTTLVVYVFALDCFLGVLLFTSYSKYRRFIVDQGEPVSLNRDSSIEMKFRWFCYGMNLRQEKLKIEVVAGFMAGATMGVLQSPVRYTASHPLWWFPTRWDLFSKHLFFEHSISNVFRQGFSHAAFFGTFSQVQHSIRYFMGRRGIDRTSMNDALIVSLAGCAAGGAYRLVSLPSGRFLEYRSKHGLGAFVRLSQREKFRALTHGLGTSLAFTMPVTGLAFLGYEAAFML